MNSSKPLQDSKKFSFSQQIDDMYFEGINMTDNIRILLSQRTDVISFHISKKELKELIGNLSDLEKGLK